MKLDTPDLQLSNRQVYNICYAPKHLLESQKWDELCDVLTNQKFIKIKLDILAGNQKNSIAPAFDLLRDFENTLRKLPTDHNKRDRISLMRDLVKTQHTSIIPSELGSIWALHNPSETPKSIIINIQDPFTNYEGRKLIVNILEFLIDTYGLKLILVEGGSKDVSLSYLRQYGSPKIRIEIAEKYLKNQKISPEEYLDIVTDKPLILWGIENKDLYEKHLKSFIEIEELRKGLVILFKLLRNRLNILKEIWKNPTTSDLEAKIYAYKEKKISLSDYISYVFSSASFHKIKITEYSTLSLFLHVHQLEKTIDFNKANNERVSFIKEIANRLNEIQVKELIKKTEELKNNKNLELPYFFELEKTAEGIGIDIYSYYHFSRYLEYKKLKSKIIIPEFVNQLDRLIDQLQNKIAPTSQYRELIYIEKQLDFIEKLLTHKILPKEHQIWRTVSFRSIADDWSSFIAEYIPSEPLSNKDIAQLQYLEEKIPDCLQDYEIAQLREEAMVENILAKLDEEKEPIVALITGGFHSSKLAKSLKENGYGILIVSPIIIHPSDESDEKLYLSVLKSDNR